MIDFRMVLDETLKALSPLMQTGWELTILRDVEGKVRLVADGPPQPSDAECAAITAAGMGCAAAIDAERYLGSLNQ